MTQALNSQPAAASPGKQYIVGISDLNVVQATEGVIVTHSLGSCLGVSVYDREAKVGGLLHSLLPDSSNSQQRAIEKPGMFVDTGLKRLFDLVVRLGGDPQRLIIKIAGAGNFLDKQGHFQIGKKNYEMVRAIVKEMRLTIHGDDCGGTKPRSLYLDLKTGVTMVRSGGEEYEL